MQVTLLYFGDCPNWQTTEAVLTRLRSEHGFELQRRRVATAEQAEQIGFRGSPTALINGLDPWADPNASVRMSCRLYRGPNRLIGSPTEEMLQQALGAARESEARTLPTLPPWSDPGTS
jgi:hypothetical protein